MSLNPDVSDVVERFGMYGPSGVKHPRDRAVIQAATCCICPENALLDAVVRYINIQENETLLLDTQAGVEHYAGLLPGGSVRHCL